MGWVYNTRLRNFSVQYLAVFLALLLSFPVPTLAGNPSEPPTVGTLLEMSLEELIEVEITIATGTPKSISKAPAIATVITAADIEDMGATTLDDALETVPGLHVVPSNFNRLNSSYSIRGILTKQNPEVLLLMDGIPITFNFNGSRPDTFNMSVANISRIEIIRGPGSAVHGDDAFAGTINIITKNGEEIDGTIGNIKAGSFGMTDTWVQYGANYYGWDVALSLDYLKSDGDRDRIIDADLQTILDGQLGTNATLAPGPLETADRILDIHLGLAKDDWNIRLWSWQQDKGGIGAGISQILDPVGYEDSNLFLGDIAYNNDDLLKNWDFGLHFSYLYFYTDNYLKLAPDGAVMPIAADGNITFDPAYIVGFTLFPDGVIGSPGSRNNTYTTEFTSLYDGLTKHLLRFGFGYKYLNLHAFEKKNFGPGVLDGTQPVSNGTLTDVTGTDNIFMEDVSRSIWHVLLQDEWTMAQNWEFTAGIRYDNYSDFGGTTNPRLALVWETRPDLTSKLLYGRAFRAPSFSESFLKNNPAAHGNSDLDPETINTVELAFDYHPQSNLHTVFNMFYYEIDGLIEHIPDPGQPTSTAQNAKDVEGHGFELEAEWQIIKTLRLRSNLAYQHSKDKNTGILVPDTPELQFYADLHWKFLPDWSVDAQYFWIGDRNRNRDPNLAPLDTRPEIKDYSKVDLNLRRKNIANHWNFAVGVRNLFDENIREPSTTSIPNDYPMEGRSIWGELRFHF